MNPQVEATINGMTPPVLLFQPKTPRYVLEWLRDTGDRWDRSSASMASVPFHGIIAYT